MKEGLLDSEEREPKNATAFATYITQLKIDCPYCNHHEIVVLYGVYKGGGTHVCDKCNVEFRVEIKAAKWL